METEFRKAEVEKELRRLRAFDKLVFPAADVFPASYWRECDVYWLLVEGKRVGCTALQREAGDEKTLYIASTALLPEWQGQGLGPLMKAWQIAYARRNGFQRIVTEARAGNTRMIRLNKSFGFRIARRVKGYYFEPEETAVVMERLL
jgi:ribosomal protein S18 acetylase RimI-like enzyme